MGGAWSMFASRGEDAVPQSVGNMENAPDEVGIVINPEPKRATIPADREKKPPTRQEQTEVTEGIGQEQNNKKNEQRKIQLIKEVLGDEVIVPLAEGWQELEAKPGLGEVSVLWCIRVYRYSPL